VAKQNLALGLLLWLILTSPLPAAADTVQWSRSNIPTQGRAGGWVLALGSDVKHPTMAIDGTLYAHKSDGVSHRLMKSTDKGYTWMETKYDGGNITSITCSTTDAKTVYVTDGSHVYWSSDSSDNFENLGGGSFPALDANEVITCLDVGYGSNGKLFIFIGTADADSGDFGHIYFIAGEDFAARWTDLKANYDVYSIACSPDFGNSYQTIALVTDETHTYIIKNYGVPGEWPHPVELLENNTSSFVATAASRICLSPDFSQTQELFIGVAAAGNGDVYGVTKNNSRDLDVNADVISLGLGVGAGYTHLLAGGTTGKIWHSSDDGESWVLSKKGPSGNGLANILITTDFTSNDIAYATTTGTESAFSVSRDGGITWNQQSLIDTKISDIIDLAPSPRYSQDNTLFMLTNHTGGEHSLWRNQNGRWERVYVSTPPDVDQIDGVELSPQYDNDTKVVFITGSSNGQPAIWKSTDSGQSFVRQTVPFPIDTWVVASDSTLFIGSYNGSDGLVYRTTNSGLTYSQGVVAGSQVLTSIALSPAYDEDKTILLGNKDGWVYWSRDSGASFEPLPPDAIIKPLSGRITIAFDPEYSSNKTIYAASDIADEGIYRFITGKSDSWENIDNPTGGKMEQMIMSAGGTLYATNIKADGGMERCLNPTFPLGPTFETVTKGLDDGAKLFGLWLSDNTLWAIDTTHTKLMAYTDSLTRPVTLTSPPNGAPGAGTIINDTVKNINLDWETLSGATEYEWQLDYETDFSSVPTGFEGTSAASSTPLPPLDPATTYYWKVRAIKPVLSPWSDKWSFATSLGTEPFAPKPDSPQAGVSGVPVRPIFQWSAIAGADRYELMVSTEAAFGNPTILKTDTYALPATAWQSNITLNYDTTYYWKVRAIGLGTASPWSAVSAFTTELSPSLSPTPSPPATPPPQPPQSAQPTAPDWISWLMPFGGVLILTFLVTMLAMLITMIILTIKVTRVTRL
jgi:photosystem II stability/assembly factor-like uncharacterized protein